MKKKYIIALFLLLNIALCLYILFLRNNLIKNNINANEIYNNNFVLDNELNNTYETFIFYNNNLKYILQSLNINSDNTGLYVFIPPYPCDACLDNELDNIKEYVNNNICNVNLIIPNYRAKDIKIYIGQNSKACFIPYDKEDIEDSDVLKFDNIIYFKIDNNIIYDVFISSKIYKDYTHKYIFS